MTERSGSDQQADDGLGRDDCLIVDEICRQLGQDGVFQEAWRYHSEFDQCCVVAQQAGRDTAAIFRLLADVFSPIVASADRDDEPFKPMSSMGNRRSFLPGDLRPADIIELSRLVECTRDPVFVARVSDTLWIASKDHRHSRKAFRAYLESARGPTSSWIQRRDWLRRAIDIAMRLGRKAVERLEATAAVEQLFAECTASQPIPRDATLWPAALAELLIRNRLSSNWAALGRACSDLAQSFPIAPGCDEPRRYYELAGEAYRLAGDPAKAREMRLAVAGHWEAEAGAFEAAGGDAFNVAHRIKNAIAVYRQAGGVPQKLEALIGDLKRMNQRGIGEMKVLSTEPIDVTPLISLAETAMAGKVGPSAIATFAGLYRPTSYEQIRESIKSEPISISSLFAAEIIAPEGNIVARVPGLSDEDESTREQAKIVQRYRQLQQLGGATTLEYARRIIVENTDDSWKDAIVSLVQASGFVPQDRRAIFERALIAGFGDDHLICAHLVIPQIENSLRSILERAGVVVTSMDVNGIQEEHDLNRLLAEKSAATVLDGDLIWEMRTLLTERLGENLRNRLCHGLLGEGQFQGAAVNVLLWLAVYLLILLLPRPSSPR